MMIYAISALCAVFVTAATTKVAWLLQEEPPYQTATPPWPVTPYGYTKPISNRPFTFGTEGR